MKILMVLSNPIITDHRPLIEAKSLIEAGHKVSVIVWDRRKEFKKEETYEEIKIFRIYNSALMNLFSNAVFQNPIWWKKAYEKALEIYEKDFKFDVVHCHDLDTLKVGVKLKKNKDCKLVYDAHEAFEYMDTSKIIKKIAPFMEKNLLKNVDYVISAYIPIKECLKKVTDKKIEVILNCKNLILNEYKKPKNKIFTICYMGSLVESRMFPDLVDIIGEIKKVKFVIASRKSGLYEEVKEKSKKYKNVEFLGEIPAKEIIPKTMECNALICMFDPNRIAHKIGLPNKIFESMVTGRPIIVTKNLYYSKNFVDKEKIGLSISNTKKDVCNAIIKLRDNPQICEQLGKNGIKAAKEKYNWGTQKKKLLKIYESLN